MLSNNFFIFFLAYYSFLMYISWVIFSNLYLSRNYSFYGAFQLVCLQVCITFSLGLEKKIYFLYFVLSPFSFLIKNVPLNYICQRFVYFSRLIKKPTFELIYHSTALCFTMYLFQLLSSSIASFEITLLHLELHKQRIKWPEWHFTFFGIFLTWPSLTSSLKRKQVLLCKKTGLLFHSGSSQGGRPRYLLLTYPKMSHSLGYPIFAILQPEYLMNMELTVEPGSSLGKFHH